MNCLIVVILLSCRIRANQLLSLACETSLTQQAIQLGLLPRLEIRRTSETEKRQIYIPRVNWLLLVAVLYLVIVFRSSSALASAYGIAVTGTMVITTTMAFLVLWKCWKWPPTAAALVIAPFLVIDLQPRSFGWASTPWRASNNWRAILGLGSPERESLARIFKRPHYGVIRVLDLPPYDVQPAGVVPAFDALRHDPSGHADISGAAERRRG
jgi:hypothetical protein